MEQRNRERKIMNKVETEERGESTDRIMKEKKRKKRKEKQRKKQTKKEKNK